MLRGNFFQLSSFQCNFLELCSVEKVFGIAEIEKVCFEVFLFGKVSRTYSVVLASFFELFLKKRFKKWLYLSHIVKSEATFSGINKILHSLVTVCGGVTIEQNSKSGLETKTG